MIRGRDAQRTCGQYRALADQGTHDHRDARGQSPHHGLQRQRRRLRPNGGRALRPNTGQTDVVFLEILKADRFVDVSLNNWIRCLPPEAVTAQLNLDGNQIARIPAGKELVIAAS